LIKNIFNAKTLRRKGRKEIQKFNRRDAEDFFGMRVGAALAANSVSDIHAVVRG